MTDPGPYDRPRRVPGRAAWNPDAIPDGSSVQVDLATGELIEVPPSQTRARRLADRAARHDAERTAAVAEQGRRNHEWAQAAREALPQRTPPGLERTASYEWGAL